MNGASEAKERLNRARLSLEGLALGDAFGECFFGPFGVELLSRRLPPEGYWLYTDDTIMARSIVEILDKHGRIDQDALAASFAREYRRHPGRGYGAGAHKLLQRIADGADWRSASNALFGGEGSFGNGGAMRAAPIGAYFADDLERVAAEAAASAAVTHAHREGQAGAVAVAIAAAIASRSRSDAQAGATLLETAYEFTPDGETRDGIVHAMEIEPTIAPEIVATRLGSGQRVLATDTVPFTLWCAARHLHDYEEALWKTAAGLGDVDTTCAIVGGIVALAVGMEGLPAEWLRRREPLDE